MTDPMTPHKLMTPHDLTTARLRLREWRASDLELHWRLERASWGRGFATEGARA
jgi:hypothetical protein